jgi:hypothetical protein
VVTDGYRVFVAEARTGRVIQDLPASKLKWGIRLNGAGPLSCEVLPGAVELAGINLRGVTRPWEMFLGVSYGPRVLECGPIQTRDYSGGVMTLTAAGIWEMFASRKALRGDMLAAPAERVRESVLTVTGSLGDIARELVRISIEDNPWGDLGRLNIRLPPVTGGGHVRTYNGFDLAWIADRLKELTEVDGGPDIRFRPQFQDGDPQLVEWVMETGTAAQPTLKQVGEDWVWDGGAAGSPVVDFDTEEDGAGMAVRAWAPGAGQERQMKLAYQSNHLLWSPAFPWLEADEKRDTENQGDLQAFADQMAAAAAYPVTIVGAKVRADANPVLGEYQPGDWATIVTPEDHPTLDPGRAIRVRLMAVDGDATSVVSLAVAPFTDVTRDDGSAGEHIKSSDDVGAGPGTWAAAADGTWAALPPGTWSEQ